MIGLARSSGTTRRAESASGMAAWQSCVSMIVGNTQLTLMVRSRSPTAMASVKRMTMRNHKDAVPHPDVLRF